MSKECKNCGSTLPDEASICLQCLTKCNDSESADSIPAPVFDGAGEAARAGAFARLSSLSKKRKAAAIISAAVIILLALLCAYLFAPLDAQTDPAIISTAGGQTAGAGDGGAPKNRFEAIVENTKEALSEGGYGEDGEKPKSKLEAIVDSVKEVVSGDLEGGTTSPGGKPNTTAPSTSGVQTTTKPAGSTDGTSGTTEPETKPSGGDGGSDSGAVLNYADWQYTENGDTITLTKYTGNDANVIIPDNINGIDVGKIEKRAFNGCKNLKTATFKDSEHYHILWVESEAFYDCPNLEKITFSKNTDLGIMPQPALKCPSLSDIEIDHWQYRFEKGALYYYSTKYWYLYGYCEGYEASTYTVPDWVDTVHDATSNLYNNKSLKKIYLSDTCNAPLKQSSCMLEGIYAGDNDGYLDKDGVLFTRFDDFVQLSIYPGGKKDKSFTMPENSRSSFGSLMNSHLETLELPSSALFYSSNGIKNLKASFPNLKTLRVSKEHPQLSEIQSRLSSKLDIVVY